MIPRTKIFLVIDQPLIHESIKLRIDVNLNWSVCGSAATIDAAVPMVKRVLPKLVLMDIDLSCGSGIDLIRELRSRFSDVKILAVTGNPLALSVKSVMKAGAQGFFSKFEPSHTLTGAIDTLLKGKVFISKGSSSITSSCPIFNLRPFQN